MGPGDREGYITKGNDGKKIYKNLKSPYIISILLANSLITIAISFYLGYHCHNPQKHFRLTQKNADIENGKF